MVTAARGATRRRLSHKGGTEVGRRAPSDTVPAWLTPNEFVEPVESARMFGPLLEAIRQAGLRQRAMSGGGMVPPDQHGGHPAGYNGGGAVGVDDAQGYGGGGWVGHHLWAIPLAIAAAATAPIWGPALAGAGGAALGTAGTAAGMAGTGEASGAAGAEGVTSVGSGLMGLASAHPAISAAAAQLGLGKAQSMLNPPQSGSDPAAAYYELRARSMQPRGYDEGGSVYQWGVPGTTLMDPHTGPYGDIGHAIQGFGAQGYYNPGGSPQAQEAMRAKAVQDAQAFGRQAYLGADVGGLDQGAANAYRLTGLTQAGQGVGQGMVNYRANQAMSDQDWARHLLEMNFAEGSNQLGRFFDYSNARNMPRGR